jgi:hypothetical protein
VHAARIASSAAMTLRFCKAVPATYVSMHLEENVALFLSCFFAALVVHISFTVVALTCSVDDWAMLYCFSCGTSGDVLCGEGAAVAWLGEKAFLRTMLCSAMHVLVF